MLGQFLTKKLSQPLRNFVNFLKKINKKNDDSKFNNLKNTKSRKMPSKWLWEPLIKSYEKILNFLNRKVFDGKVISPPQKHSGFSKRNVIKNSVFNSKNMRNTYSLFSIMITSNMSLFQKDALKYTFQTPFSSFLKTRQKLSDFIKL